MLTGAMDVRTALAGPAGFAPARAGAIGPAPVFVALGMLLSMATQLRAGGLPLGPGEVCLMGGLGLLAIEVMGSGGMPLARPFWALLLFWSAFLMAQCIGFVAGGLIGDLRDTGLVLHDAATYPLLVALTLLLVIGPQARARLHRTAWAFAILGAALTVVQLFAGLGLFSLPQVDPWYWDRFRGFAANPNQEALFCFLVGAVGLHLAEVTRGAWQKAGALLCALVPLATGTLAKTNAFTLAVTVAAALYLGLKGASWLARSGREPTIGSAAAWVAVFALPLLAASAIPLAASLPGGVSLAGTVSRDDSSETGEEAQIRFDLWTKAIERGWETDMLGLGPGPHLPIPAILVEARGGYSFEPGNVQHPTLGAAPNFESHNSLLELYLQGGLLAVGSFLALVATALARLFRARSLVLLTALCGMLLFGSFHVITRHPAVWFVLASGVAAEGRSPRRAVAAIRWATTNSAMDRTPGE